MKHLFSLNKYFWKYKKLFLLGTAFVMLSNYFRILSPQITGFIVNKVVGTLSGQPASKLVNTNFALFSKITEAFQKLNFSEQILYAGIALLALALISGFFMFLMRQTLIVMSRHIEYDQKNEIYDHYQKLDLGFFKKQATGDLMNRISEDVSRVRMYTGPAIMYLINLTAVIGFSIYFMLRSDVRLTLFALCPLPILAITIYYVNAIINKKSESIQSKLSDLTSLSQETYSGIRVIKSFVQEKAMNSFFNTKSEEYKKDTLSLAKTEAIYFPSMSLLIGLSTLITILVGGLDVNNGTEGASVGKITEFVIYIQMLTFPVSAIGWTASMIQRASASQKRINEFLFTKPSISDGPATDFNKKITGAIDILNASFTYKNTGVEALKDISMTVKKGERIAIVGKTGSGKTTLTQLLLRFWDWDKGEMRFDNQPVNQISIEELRNSISYVPQDVFLFSDSISNNIRFGNPEADENHIMSAAQQAGIHDEICSFPEGYDTIVGERGITLSGGQKQRISIARALLKNPQIIIFDDCLSAVDAKTEQLIVDHLNHLLTDKTALIVTHRLLTHFHFDNILVLEEGRIAEKGTHEELMDQKGIYFDLYNRQQSAEKE